MRSSYGARIGAGAAVLRSSRRASRARAASPHGLVRARREDVPQLVPQSCGLGLDTGPECKVQDERGSFAQYCFRADTTARSNGVQEKRSNVLPTESSAEVDGPEEEQDPVYALAGTSSSGSSELAAFGYTENESDVKETGVGDHYSAGAS